MSSPKPLLEETSSSKLDKRESLILAAMKVMREKGFAQCTARAIADASPLSKSALHYYFVDTEEIVGIAFERLIGLYISRITTSAKTAHNPTQALWNASSTYLHLGSNQKSNQIPMLWFEVQLAASRSGDTGTVHRLSQQLYEIFLKLVAATGTEEPERKTNTLFSALPGILLQDSMAPVDLDKALEDCLLSMDFTL